MPVLRLSLYVVLMAGANGQEETHGQTLARLRELSDQRLGERLEELLSHDNFRRPFEYEACLTEIVRRGKKQAAPLLHKHFDALTARKFQLSADPDDFEPGNFFNLELLTALRRAQKRPDPLTIRIETAAGPLSATPLSLPRLKVRIKNVDVEKQEVGFTFGGNYRSGRQARWCVLIVDEKGRAVPVRQIYGMFMSGGQYQEGVLKHGASWKTVLDLRDFVESPPPGKYRLQVLYHNTRTIVGSQDLSGLIMCKSASIPLVVEPAVITLTEAENRAARGWIAGIDATQKLKIVAGTYGPWAHEFISPQSPQGRLLGMGPKAVPPLIEALQDKKITPAKRAWILSLLYSSTGENDPRGGRAILDFDCRVGPWQVMGGTSREAMSGGIGFGHEYSEFSSGKIDPQAQQELTGKWIEWLKSTAVKVKKVRSS